MIQPGAYAAPSDRGPFDALLLQQAPDAEQLRVAREIVGRHMDPTPLVTSLALSQRFGRDLRLKLENLTPVRSFKLRGALACIALLSAEARGAGVVTASTGNHGQGIAYAGRALGSSTTVMVPEGCNAAKVGAMLALGARVVVAGADLLEAQLAAREMADETGMTYIEDGEEPALMAGAATLFSEMLDQDPDLETLIVPVGGGNLIASCLLAVRALKPTVQVIGVQSTEAPAATLSWLAGQPVEAECRTIAGGLATSRPGLLALGVMQAFLPSMMLIQDADLWSAIGVIFDATGMGIEPAGAAGVAALERFREEIPGSRIGVLFSGGWLQRSEMARALFGCEP